MNKNTIPSHFEDKVQAVTRMPAPDPEFVDALWGRLEAQTANASRRQRLQAAFRNTWRWSLSLAALVLLVGLLVFSMNLLPKNKRLPGAAPETPAAFTPTPTPARSQTGLSSADGMFAMMAEVGDTTQVFVLPADGSSYRMVSDGTHASSWPSLSPDGRQVVFAAGYSGFGSNYDIAVADLASGQIQRLTNDGFTEEHPLWSPDGQQIAFESDRDSPLAGKDIYLMDADGSNLKRMPAGSESRALNGWSRDGTEIYFIYLNQEAHNSNQMEILAAYNLSNGQTREIGRFPARPRGGIQAAVSLDGQRIAFVKETIKDSGTSSEVMLREDGTDRQVSDGQGDSFLPVWSPDGKWLVYSNRVQGRLMPVFVRMDGVTEVHRYQDLNGQVTSWIAANPFIPDPFTPIETSQPSSTPSIPLPATIPDRLVEGACNIPISQAFKGQYQGQANQDNLERLVGGGSADSGDITFEIWLACGAAFGKQAHLTPHFSEIEGLGLLVGWQYHGPDLEGDTQDYYGFEPFIQERGSSGGMLSSGSLNMMVSGIQFPVGIIPDFSQADVPLRYVLKVRTPDGKLSGAALSFVMQRRPDGFLPADIQVEPLFEADLQSAESPLDVQPPFPTINPEGQYPELKEARELLDRYQQQLISTPGWIHIKSQHQDPQGSGPYGQLTEWTGEEWLQIDEKGYVITFVHIDRDAAGKIIQQVVSQDGETHNLTFGTDGPYTPYRLDLSSGLYTELLRWLQSGKPLRRAETSLDGKAVWVYAFSDVFSEPREIDSVLTSALKSQYTIDQESGKLLYQELVRTVPEGQEQLVWRITYDTVERLPQPPEEIIQLLGQEPGPYQPPTPQGTPAPVGFDPAQSKLTLKSLPGDDFNQPSFWYGDLYAGGYLLGRVNFGGTPGGWCDRSADGSRLAFSFLVLSNASEGRETLRWLDLHNLAQVFDPAPDLELVSKLAWSPVGNQLAFTACKAGHSDCGLYLLDTDSNQVRRLPSVGGGYVPPVWKPDASQIAFLGPDHNDGLVLYVLDVATGETVYTGPFNTDAWQAAEDSPTNAWGVAIRREYTGSDCFINP